MSLKDSRPFCQGMEVEIYQKGKLEVVDINLDCLEILPEVARVLECMCNHLTVKSPNYQMILERLLNKIIHLTGSEVGSITIRIEGENPHLRCVALAEMVSGALPPLKYVGSGSDRIPITKFFRRMLDRGSATISNDMESDPRREHTDLPPGHPPLHTFMGIPLYQEKIISGMVIFSTINPSGKSYQPKDVIMVLPLLRAVTQLVERVSSNHISSQIQHTNEIDQAKDRFLATMSHELRTPLNGIMGMVTMLPDAGDLNEKQREYVKNLTECTYRLANLLNNILDFSKMAADRLALQLQSVSIEDVVRDSVAMVEGKAKSKGLEINVEIPVEIPALLGDHTRLVQILSNLASNAVKFTQQGFVSIQVRISRLVPESSGTASSSSAADEEEFTIRRWKVIFTVTDTGVGIAPKEQEKIFEVFHQSSSLSTYMSNAGTGLGLSIARELVRMMDGRISVTSEGCNRGSIFTFYVVLDEEIDVTALRDSHAELFHNAKILIVDDRPEMRLQLSDMMFKWKCIPQAVSSAKEALQYLGHGIKFDAALVDICMPNMSGVELAQELRQNYPSLPLIGISSVEIKAGEEYFDFYMRKPIDQYQLFPALLACLNRKARGLHRSRISPTRRIQKRKKDLRILIAEDDYHNIFTIKEMLVNLGYNRKMLTVVEDGKECVETVRQATTPFDVILMDIIMPRMDGIEATKQIKQLPHTPMIIAVSAAVQPSDKARCQRVGIDGYLAKPVIKEKLDAALSPLVKRAKRRSKHRSKRRSRRSDVKKGSSTSK